MKDDLVVAHEFGNAVADALTKAGVVPSEDKEFCSVLVIVGQPPRDPIGGSVNYDKKTKKWTLSDQLETSERLS